MMAKDVSKLPNYPAEFLTFLQKSGGAMLLLPSQAVGEVLNSVYIFPHSF